MTEQNWRNIIQDRYENNMIKVKPLLPVLKPIQPQAKKELELPKPIVQEPPILSTGREIGVEVINIEKPTAIIEADDQLIVEDKVTQTTHEEDQAADLKSNSNVEDIDLSNLKLSVGTHKTHSLKLSLIENKNKNREDFHSIEWGKESNTSFVVGKIQFPVPMFWDSDGHKMHFDDSARGSSVILSNNSNNIYVNHHHISVNDNVRSSIKIITSKFEDIDIKVLKSPIIKIMPLEYARSVRSDGVYNFHSPFSYYYMRNNRYQNDNFWYEDCFFNDQNIAYSDLITSLRILYVIGYRIIYLDGFTTSKNEFAIYDNVIKNSINKLKILNIGNNDIRAISKFDRSKAMASCIL